MNDPEYDEQKEQNEASDFSFELATPQGNQHPSIIFPEISKNRDVRFEFHYKEAVSSAEISLQRSSLFIGLNINRHVDLLPSDTDYHDRPRKFQKFILSTLQNKARTQNLIILDLERGIPVFDLLLEISGDLICSLPTEIGNESNDLIVYQYIGGEVIDIEPELRKLEGSAIVLFLAASRQQLGWDLKRLAQTALEKNLYLIASSNLPIEAWRLSTYENSYFHKLSFDGLYSTEFLLSYFKKGVETNQAKLPQAIRQLISNAEADDAVLSAHQIAMDLATPENINSFLSDIQNFRSVSPEDIIAVVSKNKYHNLSQTISAWYESLSTQDQLIALGLTFFDGLEEDCLYALIQLLIKSVWLPTVEIQLLDRINLRSHWGFFALVPAGAHGDRVKSKFYQQRILLFQAAAADHQRHINKGFWWLVDVLAKGKSNQNLREIFPNGNIPLSLRTAIIDTLIDAAYTDFDFAEPMILALIAQSNQKTHELIAKGFARWYSFGNTQKLKDLFLRWRTRKSSIIKLKNLIPVNARSISATTLLNTILVLVATHAALNDQPNQIAQEWIDQLFELSDLAEDDLIRSSFKGNMIPLLVPQYSRSVEPILRKLIEYPDLIEPIGEALAVAYSKSMHEAWKVINDWYRRGMGFNQGNGAELSQQSIAYLLIIVNALKDIQFTPNSIITPQTAFQMLQRIKQYLPQFPLQEVIWQAELQLCYQNPQYFPVILAGVSPQQSDKFVSLLTETYLRQRQRFLDGDRLIKTKAKFEVPIYLNRSRPLTPVEDWIFKALKNPRNGNEEGLILRTLLSFISNLDLEEDAFIKNYLASQYVPPARSMVSNETRYYAEALYVPAVPQVDFYFDELVPLLATLPNNENFRIKIKNIIKELQLKSASDSKGLDHLINRLKNSGDPYLISYGECVLQAKELIQDEKEWGASILGTSTVVNAFRILIKEQGIFTVIGLSFRMIKKKGPPTFIKTAFILFVVLLGLCLIATLMMKVIL